MLANKKKKIYKERNSTFTIFFTIMVYLESAYFVKIENFLLKVS